MQTRDYDDYIYISSTLGFRKVDKMGVAIDVNLETDGYCNMYAGSVSVSYLNSMNAHQVNAIHFFEENHQSIFSSLINHLSKNYSNPKLMLGFRSVNILDDYKNEICYSEYTFIDSSKNKVKIRMHKDNIEEV